MDRVETALMTIFAEPISDITQSLLSFKQVQYSHIFHAKNTFLWSIKEEFTTICFKCILHFFFFLLTAAQSLLCAKKFYFAARQIKLSQFRKLTKDIRHTKISPFKKAKPSLKICWKLLARRDRKLEFRKKIVKLKWDLHSHCLKIIQNVSFEFCHFH